MGKSAAPAFSRYTMMEEKTEVRFSSHTGAPNYKILSHCLQKWSQMWHNGRSLEPLCTDMIMLSIFSCLCKKVNKHILQKYCFFNQLKLGYQLCHLHTEKSDVKSHIRSNCSSWKRYFFSSVSTYLLFSYLYFKVRLFCSSNFLKVLCYLFHLVFSPHNLHGDFFYL